MEEDFNEIVKPFIEKFPDVFEKHELTFEDFKNAASIVSSRDFYVDFKHGNVWIIKQSDTYFYRKGTCTICRCI